MTVTLLRSDPGALVHNDAPLGPIVKINGANLLVRADDGNEQRAKVGGLVKIGGENDVIGIVESIEISDTIPPRTIISIDLVGEIRQRNGQRFFTRGVSNLPGISDYVRPAGKDVSTVVYAQPAAPSIPVGRLSGDPTQEAYLMSDELLAKHFAVVGSTGCGKSCTTTLLLSRIIERQPNAHIVMLDPHSEYATAFGDLAEVMDISSCRLPFWMLNLEEATQILVRGGTNEEQEAQAIILKDALVKARLTNADDYGGPTCVTVDSPIPFFIRDVQRNLEESMGRLNRGDGAGIYRRLLSRLDSLLQDRRYSFMFGDAYFATDCLAELVGRFFRIPVAGKPLTIVDMSGVPSEVADVVVSVMGRALFDFALWSDPKRRPPILLVCEEAHRYLPANEALGFAACRRSISRIAREGRKYGLSLALISQRPSELSLEALSQCGTVVALRLGNGADQRLVEAALPDTGRTMMRALSSMPPQEAVVFGEAVSLPIHLRFDDLPLERRPRSSSARFSVAWQDDTADEAFLSEAIRHWRMASI